MIGMFRLVEGGEHLPQRATQHSAGFDVFANEDVVIGAGETVTIGLGIALDTEMYCFENVSQLPYDHVIKNNIKNFGDFLALHYLELHPRSSLRAKGIGGGVGIIDMDYRDEIKIVLSNLFNPHISAGADYVPLISTRPYHIKRGDKIGQLILKRHEGYLLPAQYTLDAERTGGFGSTDEN